MGRLVRQLNCGNGCNSGGELVPTLPIPFGSMFAVHVRKGECHDGVGILRVVRVADINGDVLPGNGNHGGNDGRGYRMNFSYSHRTGDSSNRPFPA